MAGHFCREHNTPWFKSPKMKRYAHPVEGEFDENGKQIWCNEPAGEASEQPSDNQKPAKPAYGQDSPEKRRSIERQTSLTLALEWVKLASAAGVVLSPGQPFTCAESFYQWISEGKLPTPSSTPSDVPRQPLKTEPPSDSSTESKPTILEQALKCKDGIELYNFAFKHGHSLTSIQSAGLSKDPKQVKSVDAAARVLFGR